MNPLLAQAAMVILFATCVDYDASASPRTQGVLDEETFHRIDSESQNKFTSLQDIQASVSQLAEK